MASVFWVPERYDGQIHDIVVAFMRGDRRLRYSDDFITIEGHPVDLDTLDITWVTSGAGPSGRIERGGQQLHVFHRFGDPKMQHCGRCGGEDPTIY
jgi:hypothetical protein